MSQAFVGVSLSSKIIYNVLENEIEFKLSGISIINQLNKNPNEFMGKVIESQNYDSIKFIYDNNIIFGDFFNYNNENIETFDNVYTLMQESKDYEYFYIYDNEQKVLIVKTPYTDIIALDYKNIFDVQNFCKNIDGKEILIETPEYYEI